MVLINEDVAKGAGKVTRKEVGERRRRQTSMQMQMTFIKMREFGGVWFSPLAPPFSTLLHPALAQKLTLQTPLPSRPTRGLARQGIKEKEGLGEGLIPQLPPCQTVSFFTLRPRLLSGSPLSKATAFSPQPSSLGLGTAPAFPVGSLNAARALVNSPLIKPSPTNTFWCTTCPLPEPSSG